MRQSILKRMRHWVLCTRGYNFSDLQIRVRGRLAVRVASSHWARTFQEFASFKSNVRAQYRKLATKPTHIGGRRVLSPLRQPCTPWSGEGHKRRYDVMLIYNEKLNKNQYNFYSKRLTMWIFRNSTTTRQPLSRTLTSPAAKIHPSVSFSQSL